MDDEEFYDWLLVKYGYEDAGTSDLRQDGGDASIPEIMRGNFDDFKPVTLNSEEQKSFFALYEKSVKIKKNMAR